MSHERASHQAQPPLPYPPPRRERAGVRVAVVALLVLGAAAPAGAQQPTTLALLPFENVSGSLKGPGIIMPLIEQELRDKGYNLVTREKLEPFLSQNRIRSTGMLSRRHLSGLRKEFGVDMAVVGTVDLFYESEENPQWGLSARILSSEKGKILWAESSGLTGDDFTGMLGLGTIRSGERLAEEVVELLLRSVPPAGQPFPVPDLTARPFLRLAGGVEPGYRSHVLDSEPPRRIAVLPFENASERKGAGRILTDIFTTALFQHSGFEVIEPGEVAEALFTLKAAAFGAIDFESLVDFRQRTGVDAVILGTVYTYNEGFRRIQATAPEIELDVRMLDAGTGRILWFTIHGKSGDDYQTVLDFGKIRSMIPLAVRVVSEMLESL